MKHFKLFYALLVAIVALLFTTQKAQSQVTSIEILAAGDSVWGTPCPVPHPVEFYMYGNMYGTNLPNSVDVEVNFGDGNDTTFTALVSTQPTIAVFYTWFTHTYEYPGSYTVQYIVTDASSGVADTIVVPNEVFVGDSCGTVSGTVYLDENSNCQFDPGEPGYSNEMVSISTGGSIIAWDYTNQNGEYSFDVPVGPTYTVSVSNNVPGLTITCPPSGALTVASVPSSGNDIGMECLGGFDVTATVNGWGFRPGFDGTIYFCPRNLRCLPTSGQAMLVIDDPLVTYLSANPSPDYINGDTLVWDYTNLANNYGSYNGLCMAVQVATDTTAQIGDSICVDVVMTPQNGDADPSNNTSTTCMEVRASYDPNDKAVIPAGVGAEGRILNNQKMTYRVRFQNTGTAPAANVYILDTLDANLDINTFRLIETSHPMNLYINGNDRIKFDFPDIWLPDSTSNEPESHGFVVFSIDQKVDLANGTEIENTAYIYFDYNPPVITNTVLNTIDLSLSIMENWVEVPFNITIYPNPAKDLVNIKFDKAVSNATVSLVDISGKVVDTRSINGPLTQLETSQLPAGMYTLVFNHEESELARKKIVLVK